MKTPRERATAALDDACAAADRGDTQTARQAAQTAAQWAWMTTVNRQAAEAKAAADPEIWAPAVGYHTSAERAAWRDADAARTAAREAKSKEA